MTNTAKQMITPSEEFDKLVRIINKSVEAQEFAECGICIGGDLHLDLELAYNSLTPEEQRSNEKKFLALYQTAEDLANGIYLQ